MTNEQEFPQPYTSLWYRLRALKSMTMEQMESMLAFLSGACEVMWDEAYAQCGALPIKPIDGDPDYNDETDEDNV